MNCLPMNSEVTWNLFVFSSNPVTSSVLNTLLNWICKMSRNPENSCWWQHYQQQLSPALGQLRLVLSSYIIYILYIPYISYILYISYIYAVHTARICTWWTWQWKRSKWPIQWGGWSNAEEPHPKNIKKSFDLRSYNTRSYNTTVASSIPKDWP